MKDIIINKNEDGSNLIALVENGKLIEKYDDDESIKANEGNIYCGIVRDLLPGMQSAFVDIGEDQNKRLLISINGFLSRSSSSYF